MLAALCGCGAVAAREPIMLAALPSDLTQLSLNDLLSIEVTSVSRRAEPLREAAAAVFVLTGDEIRRSGVHSIAEALRMVPGLQVSRSSALNYLVTSRGIGADKLEVRLDGRSVYTPLASTVFWDTLDTYLPDIDRIEVIRGPGAALWGANAVNGVINIVTKAASETRGTQIGGGSGNFERAFAGARTGGRLGNAGDVRIYALAHERGDSEFADGSDAADGGNQAQAGFRADFKPDGDGDRDRVTVSGDYYHGRQRASGVVGNPTRPDASGANLLARWGHTLNHDSELSLQTYYDADRRMQPTLYAEKRETFDVDLQHKLKLSDTQEIIYGAGYRHTKDQIGQPPDFLIFVDPASKTRETLSAFGQDQISLADGAGMLTLGTKFEHNDITGFEFQPNARLGWNLRKNVFSWLSVARAVRTPNRFDTDTAIFCPPPDGVPGLCSPGDVLRIGNPDIRSETLMAYEWGLRYSARHGWSADLALFHNDYDDLINGLSSSSAFGGFSNGLRAHAQGGELTLNWATFSNLDLQAYFAALRVRAQSQSGAADVPAEQALEGSDPRQQAGLRASWRPAPAWNVDGFLRFVGRIPQRELPAYTELNLRTGWRVKPGLELALVGENLLHARHAEQGGDTDSAFSPQALSQRSLTLEVIWDWE